MENQQINENENKCENKIKNKHHQYCDGHTFFDENGNCWCEYFLGLPTDLIESHIKLEVRALTILFDNIKYKLYISAHSDLKSEKQRFLKSFWLLEGYKKLINFSKKQDGD